MGSWQSPLGLLALLDYFSSIVSLSYTQLAHWFPQTQTSKYLKSSKLSIEWFINHVGKHTSSPQSVSFQLHFQFHPSTVGYFREICQLCLPHPCGLLAMYCGNSICSPLITGYITLLPPRPCQSLVPLKHCPKS